MWFSPRRAANLFLVAITVCYSWGVCTDQEEVEMRAGRQIRWERALEHAGNKLCDCGHTVREHRELQATLSIEDGAIIETPHPDYKPLHFHCTADGCECVVVVEGR